MKIEIDQEDAKVVRLFPVSSPSAEPSLESTHRGEKPDRCHHEMYGYFVDTKLRVVTCKGCESIVDAFDALSSLTGNWDRYRESMKFLARELTKRRDDLSELKRQESNARARLRRLKEKLEN